MVRYVGDVICREGQTEEHMYIVEEGKLSVYQTGTVPYHCACPLSSLTTNILCDRRHRYHDRHHHHHHHHHHHLLVFTVVKPAPVKSEDDAEKNQKKKKKSGRCVLHKMNA